MAINVPMPDLPGDSLLKGLNTGSELMHKMMLNKYNSQLHPSGDVANAMYVQQLRNQYGEQDPRYIAAKRAHDLALQGRESLIGYRDVLNQTAGIRATSPLGKMIAEGKGQGAMDILRGNRGGHGGSSAPPNARYKVGNQFYSEEGDPVSGGNATGDNNARTPEERTAYERKIAKETGDEDARKRMRFAENLDITRQSINPENLTRYSGPQGTLKLMGEHVKSFRGNPSQEYLDYNTAVNSASLMSKQMRQFYGESIQPTATEKLDALANPSTWYKNPKVAQAQWDSLNKILDQETETYRKYGTSPIELNGLNYDSKKGKFVVGTRKASERPTSNSNEGGSFDMNVVIPQLLKINPNYTEKNIRDTARIRKTTVDNVINQLFQRGQ